MFNLGKDKYIVHIVIYFDGLSKRSGKNDTLPKMKYFIQYFSKRLFKV